MAVSEKGSRKIVIGNKEFRWRATGNDDFISLTIWPKNQKVKIIGTFMYHSEYKRYSNINGGHHISKGQIIITNRVIRGILEVVGIDKVLSSSGLMNLGELENLYDINDAIRQEL